MLKVGVNCEHRIKTFYPESIQKLGCYLTHEFEKSLYNRQRYYSVL